MRLLCCLLIIVVLRVVVFCSLILTFGKDPGTDTHIFELLANKSWSQHILRLGDYTQFPILSPVVMSALRFALEPIFGVYWSRAAFVSFELTIYVLFYRTAPGFRGSWLDYLYIVGFFTGPLTALWAQDEMIAVLPILLLFSMPASLLVFISVVVASYMLLKSFYLFAPLSRLLTTKSPYISPLAFMAIIFMIVIDNTSGFVPTNEFSSTVWTLSDLNPVFQKNLSLALFASLIAVSLVVGLWRNLSWQVIYLLVITAFLNTFYHINMEYFVFLTLPAVFVILKKECTQLTMVLICLWFASTVGTNVFYALGYSLASSEIARLLHPVIIVIAGLLGLATFISLLSATPAKKLAVHTIKRNKDSG